MTSGAGTLSSPRLAGLRALRDIARALSVAWDLDSTLDLIVRKTTEVMGVDSCSIYLLDPDGETLRLRATTGLARAVLGIATLQNGEGMTATPSSPTGPSTPPTPGTSTLQVAAGRGRAGLRSLLAVPAGGKSTIGALNVRTQEPHDFTADE